MPELKLPKDKARVSEIFGPTLQGEGQMIGVQTYFVRFAGCDYRCTKCDSLHAVLPDLIKKSGAQMMSSQEIYAELTGLDKSHSKCKIVTFSGGNPCMWDLTNLVQKLHGAGWKIAVETQGTLYHDWLKACDYVTISPKGPGMGEKFERFMFTQFIEHLGWPFLPRNICIKVVIFGKEDIEFAKMLEQNYGLGGQLYLSLGNPYPPGSESRMLNLFGEVSLPEVLLSHMRVLWEDIAKEPLLVNAKFLPQLHVLLWGNKQGV